MYHWGLMSGSIISLLLEQKPNLIGFGCSPLYNPSYFNSSVSKFLTSYLFIPLNFPPFSFISPSSFRIFICGSPFRSPHSKSLGSCPGVIFTAPDPKFMSTSVSSVITFISREGIKGWINYFPIRSL
jgi:hypothetical protein